MAGSIFSAHCLLCFSDVERLVHISADFAVDRCISTERKEIFDLCIATASSVNQS